MSNLMAMTSLQVQKEYYRADQTMNLLQHKLVKDTTISAEHGWSCLNPTRWVSRGWQQWILVLVVLNTGV
jgi:hypothetical protein